MIQGKRFIIDEKKFAFFFGKVTSTPENNQRYRQNLRELQRLGIEDTLEGREILMQIFHQGLNAVTIEQINNAYGITIIRKVEINYCNISGAIEISYFYNNGNLHSIPKITTIIPKIY